MLVEDVRLEVEAAKLFQGESVVEIRRCTRKEEDGEGQCRQNLDSSTTCK